MAGRKDTGSRRWSAAESAKLVELIQENYSFIFEALNPGKTRKMVDDKWAEITDSINALAAGNSTLTVDQVCKKWTELKSASKCAVKNI